MPNVLEQLEIVTQLKNDHPKLITSGIASGDAQILVQQLAIETNANENLYFLQELNELQTIQRDSNNWKIKLDDIVKHFINPGAPFEVNIPNSQKIIAAISGDESLNLDDQLQIARAAIIKTVDEQFKNSDSKKTIKEISTLIDKANPVYFTFVRSGYDEVKSQKEFDKLAIKDEKQKRMFFEFIINKAITRKVNPEKIRSIVLFAEKQLSNKAEKKNLLSHFSELSVQEKKPELIAVALAAINQRLDPASIESLAPNLYAKINLNVNLKESLPIIFRDNIAKFHTSISQLDKSGILQHELFADDFQKIKQQEKMILSRPNKNEDRVAFFTNKLNTFYSQEAALKNLLGERLQYLIDVINKQVDSRDKSKYSKKIISALKFGVKTEKFGEKYESLNSLNELAKKYEKVFATQGKDNLSVEEYIDYIQQAENKIKDTIGISQRAQRKYLGISLPSKTASDLTEAVNPKEKHGFLSRFKK